MNTPKIKQRNNGIYFISYIDNNGSRTRQSLKTRNELEAAVEFNKIFGYYPENISETFESSSVPTTTPSRTNRDSCICEFNTI